MMEVDPQIDRHFEAEEAFPSSTRARSFREFDYFVLVIVVVVVVVVVVDVVVVVVLS